MKRYMKFAGLAALVAIATGCASTNQPRPNDANRSRALNIAVAADLRDIKDTKVPASQYQSIRSGNLVLDAGWTWANYVNPAPGVSSGFGLGLGLATMLFPRKSPAGDNSLMAWLPMDKASNADEARLKIREVASQSIETTLNRIGYQYTGPFFEDHRLLGAVASFIIEDSKAGCGTGQDGELPRCAIVLGIDHIREAYAPETLTGQSYPSYALDSSSSARRSIMNIRSSKENKLNHANLYLELSKDMPEWMVAYVAPKRAPDGTGAENPMAFIASQGEMELFVTPE